jgi:hypothetical protein
MTDFLTSLNPLASIKQYLPEPIKAKLGLASQDQENKPGLLSQQIQTPDQIRELAIQLLAIQDPTIQLKDPAKLIYHELEFFASNDKTHKKHKNKVLVFNCFCFHCFFW